jgi:hypothetical protein
MASDMRIVYSDVSTVSSKLHQVTTDTLPRLSTVQTTVNNLLHDGGGLWLILSSPVLADKYKAFNDSVTQAVSSIPSWANQFDNIIAQLRDMDKAIADASKATG